MEETNSLLPINPPITPPVNPSSPNKSVLIISLIIFLVIFSSLVTYVLVKSQTPSSAPVVSLVPVIQASPTPSPVDETVNWKTYIDKNYHFSLKYPTAAVLEITPSQWLVDGRIEEQIVQELSLNYLGPDNKPQTEVADGYSVQLSLITKKSDKNLRELIAEGFKDCLEVGDLREVNTPSDFYAKTGTWRYSC